MNALKPQWQREFDRVLELAERVSDAWYRCQSLATVVRFAPDDKVIRVVNRALKAANLGANPYKRVAVAAGPIRALAERGKFEHASKALTSLLDDASQVEPPVSKIAADLTHPLDGDESIESTAAKLTPKICADWRKKEERAIIRIMSKPALNVSQLTPEERLELIEELWESLRLQEDRVPLTNAQRAELDRRLDDMETAGDTGIPWEEVIRQIRSRAK